MIIVANDYRVDISYLQLCLSSCIMFVSNKLNSLFAISNVISVAPNILPAIK